MYILINNINRDILYIKFKNFEDLEEKSISGLKHPVCLLFLSRKQ